MSEEDALDAIGLRREVVVAAAVVRRGLFLAEAMVGDAASIKEGRDVVTGADVAVEELITNALWDEFHYPVIGEERGGDRPIDGAPHWLVDPICGTRNYASGVPLYCVNIALVVGDEVVGAAVADASTGAILVAERGCGTWRLTPEVLRLHATDETRTIVIEDGKSTGDGRERAAALVAAAIRADRWDFRSFGTTLSFVYLATGQISAYVLPSGTAEVHRAAGTLLVSEAGGVLSELDGRPWRLGSPSLIAAATSDLRDELVALAVPRDSDA